MFKLRSAAMFVKWRTLPAVGLLLLGAFGSACGGNDDDEVAETATAPSASPTATPTEMGGDIPEIEVLALIGGIPGTVIYTLSTMGQSDGGPLAVVRHSTQSAGATSSTTILDRDHPVVAGFDLASVSGSPDGSFIAALLTSNSALRVIASRDEGATWSTLLNRGLGGAWLFQATAGRVLVPITEPGSPSGSHTFVYIEDGTVMELEPPAAAGVSYPPVLLGPAGDVAWLAEGAVKVLAPDGRVLFEPAEGPADVSSLVLIDRGDDGRWYLAWGRRDPANPSGIAATVFGVFSANGSVEELYELPGVSVRPRLSADGTLIVSIPRDATGGTHWPSIVDLAAGTIQPIQLSTLDDARGNRIIGFRKGS